MGIQFLPATIAPSFTVNFHYSRCMDGKALLNLNLNLNLIEQIMI